MYVNYHWKEYQLHFLGMKKNVVWNFENFLHISYLSLREDTWEMMENMNILFIDFYITALVLLHCNWQSALKEY